MFAARVCARSAVPAVGVRALHASAPRCDFGWQKLVTPLTNPTFTARMKELDSKFSSMRQEMHGVEPTVQPIDWAHWEKQLTNKNLVRQLRAEYESLKFEELKGEDLSKINKDLDFAIEKSSAAAEISKKEMGALKERIEKAKANKAAIHTWQLEDYFRAYPGLEQEMRDEYMRGEYLPSDAEERLEAQDINETRKQLRTGIPINLPDDLPDRVCGVSRAEELAKVDKMLDAMFGGNKAYEADKAARRAEAAKRAAAAAAAAHHH